MIGHRLQKKGRAQITLLLRKGAEVDQIQLDAAKPQGRTKDSTRRERERGGTLLLFEGPRTRKLHAKAPWPYEEGKKRHEGKGKGGGDVSGHDSRKGEASLGGEKNQKKRSYFQKGGGVRSIMSGRGRSTLPSRGVPSQDGRKLA